MDDVVNQFVSSINTILDWRTQSLQSQLNSLPTNSAVDNKISAAIAASAGSSLAPVIPSEPVSISETVIDKDSCTVYFVLDASLEILSAHISTPIQVNCHVDLFPEKYDLTITETFNSLTVNDLDPDLLFRARFGAYTDEDKVQHRSIIFYCDGEQSSLKLENASGELVWDSLAVQALQTTIDEVDYQIPLLSCLTKYETLFGQFQLMTSRIRDIEARIAKLENP